MIQEFKNITAEVPVIGFTGPLGSGCSYLSQGLAKFHGYLHCELSQLIHELLKESDDEDTPEARQECGNYLRRKFGLDVLVKAALEEADAEWASRDAKGLRGIVVDGIRNTGEVEALRQLPNFYLISVHASQEVRKRRLVNVTHKCNNEEHFLVVDSRDAHEYSEYGQQVKRCNDLADIVVRNEKKEVNPEAEGPFHTYIDDIVCSRYIALIESVAAGRRDPERRPHQDEALMTAAYVESRRSSCLKRQVGAVIATKNGTILAAAHNDVPEGTDSCLKHPEYGWCARDVLLEKLGQKFSNCPACGEPIQIKAKCLQCGAPLDCFLRRCPMCMEDPSIQYECPGCGTDVFRDFLPGGSPETGRMLDMCRALHAEENAILAFCGTGANIPEKAALYVTTFPCNLCANKILQLGIKKVVYTEPYITKEALRTFGDEVELVPFEGVKSKAYFRLYS